MARPAHRGPGPCRVRADARAAWLALTGMYFTLAVSAASREVCAALTGAALDGDPRGMPIPGPARVAWRAADERQAVVHWGSLADGTGPAGWCVLAEGPGPAEGAGSGASAGAWGGGRVG